MNRRRAVLVIVGVLGALGLGLGLFGLVYEGGDIGEIRPTVIKSDRVVLFWEGEGRGPYLFPLAEEKLEEVYNHANLSLRERFGDRFVAVGWYEPEKWLVVLQGLSPPTPAEVKFVRSLFPGNTTLRIIGIYDCDLGYQFTVPPYIRFNC